ncbi:MAG: hypothetical protein NTU78_14580 [Alphaproteobacteria bacterium]|nr:hypothetical protein [Alphaproteobacteria bacterium]
MADSSKDEQPHSSILKTAVARIRAQGDFFSRKEYSAFGVDAMDDWIGQMETVQYFCPPCQAKAQAGWRSAMTVARAMTHRSGAAAAFLRRQLPGFPPDAKPRIMQAASYYDQIIAMLNHALIDSGSGNYRQFIGDIRQQKIHADRVLRPIKDLLATAADEMERALAAMK